MTKTAGIKPILKKETPEKRVSFGKSSVVDEDDAASKANNHKKKLGSSRSGERIVQPGGAKPLRDLCLLIGILGIMLFATRNFHVPGRDSEDTDEEHKDDVVSDTLNSIASRLAKSISVSEHFRAPRKADCEIFVNRGAMRRTGYSVFAGREYAAGERLNVPLDELLPIPSADDSTLLWLQPYAFLIKHHPTLANVEGHLFDKSPEPSDRLELVATRPIEIGEELFVEYKHHPATQSHLFDHIPSLEEHRIAEELVNDMKSTSKRLLQSHRKTGKQVKADKYMSGLLIRSIEHFNPRVAALLEEQPSLSTGYHKVSSTCLGDLERDDETIVAKLEFPKGHILLDVPLYIYDSKTSDNDCKSSRKKQCSAKLPPRYCFAADENSTMQYCPLTTTAGMLRSDKGIGNVEFKWVENAWSGPTKPITSPPGTLAWQLVTLEAIEAGQEVR